MTTRNGASDVGVDRAEQVAHVVVVDVFVRDVGRRRARRRVHLQHALLEFGDAGLAAQRQRPCGDELHAVVLARVVRRGHHGAAVEAALGDTEVEHLGGDGAEVGDRRAGAVGAGRERRRELGRRGARVAADGEALRAQLRGQRRADALGHAGVDLFGIKTTHVVGLEDAF